MSRSHNRSPSLNSGNGEAQIALQVSDLTVCYNRKPVIWDIDFSIPTGVLVGVVGPNGAGKSTLLKAILGLVPKNSGRIEILGQASKQALHRVGYVPQRESVDWDFPVSALDVVAMGLYRKIGWLKRVQKKHLEIARNALSQVGIPELADRQINQLSGGQQQRVFLARALVQDAEIYLMDEPFAAVDASTEIAIVEVLRELKARGRTVVVIHHDLQTVRDYFDEVLLLNMRIVDYGPVGRVFTPENVHKTYGGRNELIRGSS